MADALDKIQKLIRLATQNPNASEARAAALKAVQMIVQHQIRLSGPGRYLHEEIPIAPPPPAPTPTPTPAEYDDFWRRSWAQYGQAYRPRPRPEPPPRPRRRVPSPFRDWLIVDVANIFAADQREMHRLFFQQWRPTWRAVHYT